jgi:hypothetical protein
MVPIATTHHCSDGWLTSQYPLLLHTIVVRSVFCPSLLYYNCSNTVLVMDQLPTVTYDPLLQWCAVVVGKKHYDQNLKKEAAKEESSNKVPKCHHCNDWGHIAFKARLTKKGNDDVILYTYIRITHYTSFMSILLTYR